MTSIKDNTIFDKTSFLESSNSSFIEELYLKYINNPENVPQSWREFFDGLNEDKEVIKKEISGPSWAPKKNEVTKNNLSEKNLNQIKSEKKNAETINGEEVSRGYSGNMYWKFEDCISHTSRAERLHPGEFFCSGTVGGGCGLEHDRFLSPNDIMELEIIGIGTLRNRIVRPS